MGERKLLIEFLDVIHAAQQRRLEGEI